MGALALYKGGTALQAGAAAPFRADLAVMAAGFVVLSIWSQRMPSGATLQPGLVFSTAGIFLLPPMLAILAPVAGLLLFSRGRRRLWMYPVLIGQHALSIYLGALVYHWLTPDALLQMPRMLPGALAALLVYATVQLLITTILVAVAKNRPFISQLAMAFREDFNWGTVGLNLMGVATALAYRHYGYWSLILQVALVICLFQSIAYYTKAGIWQRAAWTDGLTGVENRAAWEAFLKGGGREHSQRRATLFLMDLDGFKSVNDRFGHLAGDKLLREIARALSKNLRKDDRLFRFGGDEFLIYVAHGQENDGFVRERITWLVDQVCRTWSDKGFRVSASLGIVSLPQESDCLREAFQMADARMYAQKEWHHQITGHGR